MSQCIAEVIGTFILVFFGTGAVFVAVYHGALGGLFDVGMIWALGIALAIYATAGVSGAHINPAVTLAVTVFRGFPVRNVVPYIVAQVIGAFLASTVLFGLFHSVVADHEITKGITRGAPGSEQSAMVFGAYFPNPGIIGVTPEAFAKVSWVQAMGAEALAAAVLVFFVFAFTDSRNPTRPNGTLFAVFIGVVAGLLIAVIAPITQGGFNPARDFGPRLFAFLAGWGEIALPGPRGFFTVYTLSPLVGGIVGGAVYDLLIRPGLPPEPSGD